MLNAAKENNVKRVIFASSSSVYGDSTKYPFNEKQKPAPASPYAITKIAGNIISMFYKLYSLETISLRYFTVYG